jgi:hypothetical protein
MMRGDKQDPRDIYALCFRYNDHVFNIMMDSALSSHKNKTEAR